MWRGWWLGGWVVYACFTVGVSGSGCHGYTYKWGILGQAFVFLLFISAFLLWHILRD